MRTTPLAIAIVLLGYAVLASAQINPGLRPKPGVADTTMVFEDRGQRLEVYPGLRATPTSVRSGASTQHKLTMTTDSAPIDPGNLGIVYNHSLGTTGFLTGEIAFKPKEGAVLSEADLASYPRRTQLTGTNTWVVVTASPREFLDVHARLKARTDLEWVEAVVVYGVATNQASAQRPARNSP